MEKELKKEGYSKEEEYFHKLNQTLIKKIQEKGKDGGAENPEKQND